jgi:hypothetical protein
MLIIQCIVVISLIVISGYVKYIGCKWDNYLVILSQIDEFLYKLGYSEFAITTLLAEVCYLVSRQ